MKRALSSTLRVIALSFVWVDHGLYDNLASANGRARGPGVSGTFGPQTCLEVLSSIRTVGSSTWRGPGLAEPRGKRASAVVAQQARGLADACGHDRPTSEPDGRGRCQLLSEVVEDLDVSDTSAPDRVALRPLDGTTGLQPAREGPHPSLRSNPPPRPSGVQPTPG